jgi:hypothetical protein
MNYEFWKRYVDNLLNAVMFWFDFGLKVIPIVPRTKRTMVTWNDWLDNLKFGQILDYWDKHPNHEVGCIVGDGLIVFDCDTSESVSALTAIEDRFRVSPKLVVNTAKGQHHYFRRAPGTIANLNEHDSEKHPKKIDIKTGRALIVLPISAGKTLHTLKAENTDGLSEVSQEFIDAINLHNSRTAPSEKQALSQEKTDGTPLYKIEVVSAEIKSDCKKSDDNPLSQYCLRDINELEKLAVKQVQILGDIALLGQATVIYAKQNTGKTLLVFYLIIEGIKTGKFDPAKLIYINMDDDSNGLAVKARISEEYGFRMVADGHHGFEAKKFRLAMEEMIKSDTAQGIIIILDTLKKFVNIMDKGKSTNFAKVVRQFVLKGGTVIALSHTNKHPGSDGKQIYGGTTDIIDDFDAGYILNTVSVDPDNDIKIVEFENIKRRGNVTLSASYSYALSAETSYHELLLSIEEVDPLQLISVKKANEMSSDAEIINAIKDCIMDGVNTKMILAEAAAERSLASKRQTIKVIDKYTGNDPEIHEWHFVYGKHGAKIYELLTPLSEDLTDPDIVDF